MAIKEMMFDDLDGSMIEEDHGGTVSFSFRGKTYEVELTHANEQKLADALAPFIAVARKPNGHSENNATPRALPPMEERPYELIDARNWLMENGHDVSKRGPIQEHFLKIYEEANGLGEGD